MKNTHKISAENAWESGELGATASFVHKVASENEKMVDEKLDLQVISIRLQKMLIDELKELSIEDGLGYQPYIRQVLTQHVRNKSKKHGEHLQAM